MEHSAEKVAISQFKAWCGRSPEMITPLPPSGSARRYSRISSGRFSAIAAYNPDERENKAFLTLTRIFLETGLPVPRVFDHDLRAGVYLLEDLGDTTLFSLLPQGPHHPAPDAHITSLYKKTIRLLTAFQCDAARRIDFSICYPRHAFDRQSMQWDLNYFKYYFLKPSDIPFDEQLLEDDFNALMDHLLKESGEFFMYRDMQSRNVMIVDNEPFFIDYQGGRKGPPAYDMASLLFDAKANLPHILRDELLTFYMDCLQEKVILNRQAFRRSFFDFVLMRILQALGAYGFRGGIEKKGFFAQSLPYALKNLAWLSEQELLPEITPYLNKLVRQMAAKRPAELIPPPAEGLTVTVSSFSYKKGIPMDHSGHGGGFVFDCRVLPNPGREEKYRMLTGLDREVIHYLSAESQVKRFVQQAIDMVSAAAEGYIRRGFSNLTVCFGCTGGRHRSVYCAELLAAHLRKNYNISVYLTHTEAENWKQEG